MAALVRACARSLFMATSTSYTRGADGEAL